MPLPNRDRRSTSTGTCGLALTSSGFKRVRFLPAGLLQWLVRSLAVAFFFGLAGCAAPQPGSGTQGASSGQRSSADLVTSSDEPENRKRARIRLELAVGYFEQGQTTVALDEVKLSLAADPLFVDALNVRGLIYMRLNEPALAEESFRRALSINPGDGGSLHNLGWLNCQRARYNDAAEQFRQALASPLYADRARTFMTKGLCEMAAGRSADAEDSLTRAYALDAANPIVGYNLADLLYKRREFNRAQFYIRRLNNSELANAQTLWLGVKIERELNNPVAMAQLGEQLRRRYPQSPELAALERGSFNE